MFFRFYFCFIFLLQLQLHSKQDFDYIISLGSTCEVAHQIKVNNFQRASFPFDWIYSSFNSLYLLLQTKFKNFLKKENLFFHEGIKNTDYEIVFLHDFKLNNNFLLDFEAVSEKYNRRIRRFYSVLKSSKKVLFIRQGITQDQAIMLRDLLNTLFPNINYTLLALDSSEEIKVNWHIDKIINKFLPPIANQVWQGDNLAWRRIFDEL